MDMWLMWWRQIQWGWYYMKVILILMEMGLI